MSALAFLMAKKKVVPILSLGLPVLARSFYRAWDAPPHPSLGGFGKCTLDGKAAINAGKGQLFAVRNDYVTELHGRLARNGPGVASVSVGRRAGGDGRKNLASDRRGPKY